MYGMMLLATLGVTQGQPWEHKHYHYPPPIFDGKGYPGYHNPGGWGKPYGGYGWPGYGAKKYPHIPPPMVTLPYEPLIVPPPGAFAPRRDDDEDDRGDGDGSKQPKEKPKDDRVKPETPREGNKTPARIGLLFVDASKELAEDLGYSGGMGGVLVYKVDPKGLAARAGLKQDLLIVSIDGQRVKTAEDAYKALGKGSKSKGIKVRVRDARDREDVLTISE